MGNKDARRLPVVALGAEHLAMGGLMRRNILAYKAPPGNEGYDLICIHPDPKHSTKIVRVQVKSRYQTDSDRSFPVKEKTFAAFDYLIVVFLNIGYFFRKSGKDGGNQPPELYTLPRSFVMQHHYKAVSGWQKVRLKGVDVSKFKDDLGFEQIAQDLGIPSPNTLLVENLK
jgi:hypothetical protein